MLAALASSASVALNVFLPAVFLATAATGSPQPPADEPGLGLVEAVELTLANDPNIALVTSQVTSSRGALLSASGRFDPLVTSGLTRSSTETPLDDATSSESTALVSTFGVVQELRTGLSLEPSVELVRSGEGSGAVNEATVAFTFRQPLLRGRGREVVTAGERAAELEVAASRLDLEHTLALRLRAVIIRYWSAAAAAADLQVLRTTEESSRRLLETTRKLIAADVTPAAEIVQLEADLTSREASRIAGEQALFEARQLLGLEIGLEPDEIASLPLPTDPFPTVEGDRVPTGEDAERFIRLGLGLRADLRAARERLTAAETLLAAADDALEPRLDLVLTPSYSGLAGGGDAGDFFSPLYRNVPGLSTSLGLSLSWPTFNRQAEGDWIQTRELRERSVLRVALQERSIGAEVPTALDGVRSSARRLERAIEAVGLFEQVVENEEKKLRAGSSTLIDVLNQRDRLTAARQRRVSAQLALALALVELRFQTGTLVESGGGTGTIDPRRATTIPSPEATR